MHASWGCGVDHRPSFFVATTTSVWAPNTPEHRVVLPPPSPPPGALLRPPPSPPPPQLSEAIHYAIKHDDGARPEEWAEADCLILGVSRAGKSPLSMFLAPTPRPGRDPVPTVHPLWAIGRDSPHFFLPWTYLEYFSSSSAPPPPPGSGGCPSTMGFKVANYPICPGVDVPEEISLVPRPPRRPPTGPGPTGGGAKLMPVRLVICSNEKVTSSQMGCAV